MENREEQLEVKVQLLRRVAGGNVPPVFTVYCDLDATVGQLVDMLCLEYGEAVRDAVINPHVTTIVNGVSYLNSEDVSLRLDNEKTAEVCFFFTWSNGG